MQNSAEIDKDLLAWYGANARDLPWRVPPEADMLADPYKVWLSEIMLQQTTVTAVIPYFEAFMRKWPNVQALAAAKDEDVLAAWAGLGYYARARNLLKTARIVAGAGAFPATEATLLALPGVGPYTAAAIAAIAFGAPAVVVDGNIERVMARLFNAHAPLPKAKPELKRLAASLTPKRRAGDYAQALMDLGAHICIAKTPRCAGCPLQAKCAGFAKGTAAGLPKRSPKKPKPTRRGIVYFAQRPDGQVLLETRPPKGLLGGMLGLVGSVWAETPPVFAPPFTAAWQRAEAEITHVFTHFNLELVLYAAPIGNVNPHAGSFVPAPAPEDLPSIMRKAYIAGLDLLS